MKRHHSDLEPSSDSEDPTQKPGKTDPETDQSADDDQLEDSDSPSEDEDPEDEDPAAGGLSQIDNPRKSVKLPLESGHVANCEWTTEEKAELFRLLGKCGRHGLLSYLLSIDADDRKVALLEGEKTKERLRREKRPRVNWPDVPDEFSLLLTKTPAQIHQYLVTLDVGAQENRMDESLVEPWGQN